MAREVALGSSAHSIMRRLRAQNCGSTGAFCAVRLANSVTTTSTLRRRLRASALSSRALADRSALNLLSMPPYWLSKARPPLGVWHCRVATLASCCIMRTRRVERSVSLYQLARVAAAGGDGGEG